MKLNLIGVLKLGVLCVLLYALSGKLLPLVQASQEDRNSQIGVEIGQISRLLSGVADKVRSGSFQDSAFPVVAEACKTGKNLLKTASLPDHLSNLRSLNSACVDWGRAMGTHQFDPMTLVVFSDNLASDIRQQHDSGVYSRMIGARPDVELEVKRAVHDMQAMSYTKASWQFSDKLYSILSAIQSI